MYRSKRTYGVVKPFSSRTSKHHRAKSDDEIICSYHEYGTKTKDDHYYDRESNTRNKENSYRTCLVRGGATPSTNALNAVKALFNNSKNHKHKEEKEDEEDNDDNQDERNVIKTNMKMRTNMDIG